MRMTGRSCLRAARVAMGQEKEQLRMQTGRLYKHWKFTGQIEQPLEAEQAEELFSKKFSTENTR